MESNKNQDQQNQNIQNNIQNNPMVQSLLKKNEGNKLFGEKKYQLALDCYLISQENLQKQLDDNKNLSEQHLSAFKNHMCIIKNNIAASYIELYKYKEAIQICDEIIKDFPKSIKAIFRRGVAYLQLDQLEKANEDLKLALSLNPGNPEILKVIDVATRRLQDPVHLTRIIMNGGFKFDMKDPYIYDPKRETKEKFEEPNEQDKNFKLEGCRDFDLKKAKQHREKYPRSIDMLHKSVSEDSWAYIDKQVSEEFGFSKLEQDQWHLLLGIYQVLMIYQNIDKEVIEKQRQENKLDEYFSTKFDQQGWFKYDERELQCLYYKFYRNSELNISK